MAAEKKILNFTVIIFLFFGSIYFVIALFDAVKVISSENWPVTGGKITVCSIESDTDSYGEKIYYLKVRYQYSVDGTEHTGGRISYTEYFSDSVKNDNAQDTGNSIVGFLTGHNPGSFGDYDRGIPEFLSKRFPVGKAVIVFYDPDNPAESFLEKGGIGGRPLLRCLILFFLAGAAAVFRFAVIEAGKKRSGQS